MEIRIQSSKELERLLDFSAKDIVDSELYYHVFTGIKELIEKYHREMNQSNTFWWLTLQSMKEAYLFRLCRTYDQQASSLNLVNLLDTIQSNLHFFDEPHFRERLKDNAFVDSLADGTRKPSEDELLEDIEFVSIRNPLIKKLMVWRGAVFAHTSAKIALGKNGSLDEINKEEIEILLNRSYEIFNKYLNMFKATSWSRSAVGKDDYKNVLNLIRIGLEKQHADFQKEFDDLIPPAPPQAP